MYERGNPVFVSKREKGEKGRGVKQKRETTFLAFFDLDGKGCCVMYIHPFDDHKYKRLDPYIDPEEEYMMFDLDRYKAAVAKGKVKFMENKLHPSGNLIGEGGHPQCILM
jgi:hypothetical protein